MILHLQLLIGKVDSNDQAIGPNQCCADVAVSAAAGAKIEHSETFDAGVHGWAAAVESAKRCGREYECVCGCGERA